MRCEGCDKEISPNRKVTCDNDPGLCTCMLWCDNCEKEVSPIWKIACMQCKRKNRTCPSPNCKNIFEPVSFCFCSKEKVKVKCERCNSEIPPKTVCKCGAEELICPKDGYVMDLGRCNCPKENNWC